MKDGTKNCRIKFHEITSMLLLNMDYLAKEMAKLKKI